MFLTRIQIHPRTLSCRRRLCPVRIVALTAAILALTGCGGGGGNNSGQQQVSSPSPSNSLPSTAPSYSGYGFPPRVNGAWAYDPRDKQGSVQPGYFVDAINQYNLLADSRERIRMVHPYGGDMEMYCPNGDPSQCTPSDFHVYYPMNAQVTPPGQTKPVATNASTLAYKQGLDSSLLSGSPVVAPTIDGVVTGGGYLAGFNDLTKSLADAFADKVAQRLCSDPELDGVQFDLEHFSVSTKNGQYYFYKRIARDFASGQGFNCRNNRHPNGRFFSVFTTSIDIKPGTTSGSNVAAIMSTAQNAYIIDPLYDLLGQPSDYKTSLADYQTAAMNEAARMRQWADQLGIKYELAIPAAATHHEYQTCTGSNCQGTSTATQLDYATAAIQAIDASGARSDPLSLGVTVWTWSTFIGDSNASFQPTSPTPAIEQYMAGVL